MCFPYDFNFMLAESYSQTPEDFPVREKSFCLGPLSRFVTTLNTQVKLTQNSHFRANFLQWQQQASSFLPTTGSKETSPSTHSTHMKH